MMVNMKTVFKVFQKFTPNLDAQILWFSTLFFFWVLSFHGGMGLQV